MEKREAIPVTTESFLAFASNAFERDLSDKEIKGLTNLVQKHSPDEVHGYFLDVIAKAQQKEMTLDQYLTDGRKKPLSVQSKISQLISQDTVKIKNADESARVLDIEQEYFRRSPDLWQEE